VTPLVVVYRAQSDGTTTTTVSFANPEAEGALPRPNSGKKPEAFGDRGAAGQQLVFGALVLAFVVIGFVIVRSTRRNSRIRNRST
jgi:hypothetical protein